MDLRVDSDGQDKHCMLYHCHAAFSNLSLDCKENETSNMEVSNRMDSVYGCFGSSSFNNPVSKWITSGCSFLAAS